MEIYITKQMIIYLAATLFLLWLIIYFAYRFGSWKLRIKLMKKLAKELNLEFSEKNEHKIHYALTGNYLEKTISIEEFNSFMSPVIDIFSNASGEKNASEIYTPASLGFGTQRESTKKLIITVGNKIIYERNGDRFLPFPNKIKKILDKYIKEGKITKSKTSPILAVILLFGFCIIFTILFVTLILN